MAKKESKFKKKISKWAEEFKKFISKGNAFMLAVGVVIGGAFNAIVTSLVSILMSVATWAVPGGLKGLVTVLPAASETQEGAAFIGITPGVTGEEHIQWFKTAEVNKYVIAFAKQQGKDLTVESDDFVQWKNSLLSLYELHGDKYTYKMSAIIDWGTFINALIAFFIVALTLFIIVKVVNTLEKKQLEMKEKIREEYYKKHPEERPVEPDPGAPAPTELDVLTEIRDQLKSPRSLGGARRHKRYQKKKGA